MLRQTDGFLAAIEPHEVAAFAVDDIVITARKVAVGPFDFNDTGPGVGQSRRAERRRDRLLQRNHQ